MDGVCLIVIDPVADFIEPQFSFGVAYGESDISPLINVVKRLSEVILEIQTNSLPLSLVLVTSIYKENQFSHPHLQQLCTTSERQKSLLSPSLFHHHIIKTNNSFFETHKDSKGEMSEILPLYSHYIISGLTTQSCIYKSTTALEEYIQKEGKGKTLTVIEELVAGRLKGHQREQKILSEWKEKSSTIRVCKKWDEYKEEQGWTSA